MGANAERKVYNRVREDSTSRCCRSAVIIITRSSCVKKGNRNTTVGLFEKPRINKLLI